MPILLYLNKSIVFQLGVAMSLLSLLLRRRLLRATAGGAQQNQTVVFNSHANL